MGAPGTHPTPLRPRDAGSPGVPCPPPAPDPVRAWWTAHLAALEERVRRWEAVVLEGATGAPGVVPADPPGPVPGDLRIRLAALVDRLDRLEDDIRLRLDQRRHHRSSPYR